MDGTALSSRARYNKMRSMSDDPEAKCPVDDKTREKWLEAAKTKSQQQKPPLPPAKPSQGDYQRFSLDTLTWQPSPCPTTLSTTPKLPKPKMYRLSTDREISTIPRALPTNHDRIGEYNHAELAASTPPPNPTAASHGTPANSEADTGHDKTTGNWIYPSQEMFFAAMRRKGHSAEPADMSTIIPIHNAVNEKAWSEIKTWEAPYTTSSCPEGPKLVSFAGDSKALTPRARWKGLMGYQEPFDRHDWVVDRCGKRVEYVIDFYSGKDEGVKGKGLNFYLDVRPKLNTWEGVKMRMFNAVGM